ARPGGRLRALHLDEQRGLEAELGLRAHLDARLHELALAVVRLLEVVFVAGPPRDDDVQRRVQVELRPLVVPEALHRAPVLELEGALLLERPPLLLRVPGAALVHLLQVCLAELTPGVGHAVDDGDPGPDALLTEAHHVVERAAADADQVRAGRLLDTRSDVLAAAFRVEHRDRPRELDELADPDRTLDRRVRLP